jgi:gamma-glutamyltranspeptidase
MYYTPGIPMHTTALANYYNSTYFKILLNPATLVATTKGKIPVSINDQIKDYMDDTDKKATAKKQFAIGDKQYFGYYDRDSKEYIIENIMILK